MQNTEFFSQNTESFFMGCTGLVLTQAMSELCVHESRVLPFQLFIPYLLLPLSQSETKY